MVQYSTIHLSIPPSTSPALVPPTRAATNGIPSVRKYTQVAHYHTEHTRTCSEGNQDLVIFESKPNPGGRTQLGTHLERILRLRPMSGHSPLCHSASGRLVLGFSRLSRWDGRPRTVTKLHARDTRRCGGHRPLWIRPRYGTAGTCTHCVKVPTVPYQDPQWQRTVPPPAPAMSLFPIQSAQSVRPGVAKGTAREHMASRVRRGGQHRHHILVAPKPHRHPTQYVCTILCSTADCVRAWAHGSHGPGAPYCTHELYQPSTVQEV